LIPEKYKALVHQRIRSTFEEWANRGAAEEKEVYRFLHNLKGTAGTIGMAEIEREADRLLPAYSDIGTHLHAYDQLIASMKTLAVHLSEASDHMPLTERTVALTPPMEEMGLADNRILIVDDDVELADYLKGLLEARGYPVHIALTAERGLKLFYDWKPDIILLDILLPDTNGMEVLRKIVTKSQKEHSPILVTSTEDTRENRLHAYRYGAMDFVAKPIDSELLIALVENRVELKRQWECSIILDELTGMYNRKHFNRMIRQLIASFQRTGKQFAIALMDLDHFKQINDTYGHLMGDEVLRKFAEIASAAKREEDILCRYGGEEFVLLLPDTDKSQALTCLEQIREQFGAYLFEAEGQPFQVTFTAGITHIHADNAHPEKLVEEADQALYNGKKFGRNQSVLYIPQASGIVNEQTLHVLVVDDDALIRELVVSQFLQWQPNRNIRVSVASYEDGAHFLASDWYAEQDKYVILLDGAMPTIDGREVLDRLRREFPERNIAVAMLTARFNQSDIIHALQHGADDYIVKPFQMPELVARVERLVQKLFHS